MGKIGFWWLKTFFGGQTYFWHDRVVVVRPGQNLQFWMLQKVSEVFNLQLLTKKIRCISDNILFLQTLHVQRNL